MSDKSLVKGVSLLALAMVIVPVPALAVGGAGGQVAERAAPARKVKHRGRMAKGKAPVVSPQTASGPTDPSIQNEDGRLVSEIIVMGLRENVRSARNAKRRASQIVDVVVAQDIGKLPDKNVPEALARVPGVQIDRDRGEGGTVLIRGLGGVLTTVNGSPSFSAGDRTTYLQDISSDLVSGIEVFKTRTPDQVEGSLTGVINLTLRRPTDFKTGATYAINVRGDYSDQARKLNPQGSALVAYNADTSIGKIGFMVNGTFNRIAYNEAVRWNGIPNRPGDNRQIVDPPSTPTNIFMPDQVGFAGPNGWSRRATVQVSTDWRPDDNLHFVLEGGLNDQRMLWADNQFNIPVLDAFQRLSNIQLSDDGRAVESVSVDGITPIGPGRQSWLHHTRGYNGRFEAQYVDDRVDLRGQLNYNKSNNDSNFLFHYLRFNQQPQFDVVFNTPNDPKGGAEIVFKNIDLTNTNNYRYIDGINQERQYTYSSEKEAKFDLKLNTDINLIDYIKFGFRYAGRNYERNIGGRNFTNLRLPIASLADYRLSEVGPLFPGSAAGTTANWLIGDSDAIRRNFTKIRELLVGFYPDLVNADPAYDRNRFFGGTETSYTGYGMFHYNLDLLFPIEGVIGARIVNSVTNLQSYEITNRVVVQNGITTRVTETELVTPRGNYLNVMPSVNATVHFTPTLQLRLAYTSEVGRPSAYDLNPRTTLNLENPANLTAFAGNPKLTAIDTRKYDASLEWYFGKTGSASIAVWQWDQDGFIARRTLPEVLQTDLGEVTVFVDRPYNLGRGRNRGIEGSLTTFFSFLPGFLKSFGGTVNGTMNLTRQEYPVNNAQGQAVFTRAPMLNVSKYAYNLIGFFEHNGLNIRVAYNWRSRRQLEISTTNPYRNRFIDPVERLDASINYDVTKSLTIALQADNLTKAGNQLYFGSYEYPQDIRYFARNFSASIRARF